ncbi:MAG TPA: hypothetical protein ENK05_10645 [Gammaproteobacteria bacterium]|nr:hypothetical protein [Gammaproteobacteria bacterium]
MATVHRTPHTQIGLSLLEALVTVLVLDIGLLGLGRLQLQLWRAATEIRSETHAIMLASSELELLHYLLSTDTDAPIPAFRDQRDGGSVFHSRVSMHPASTLAAVTAEVSWQSRGASRSVRLDTVVSTAARIRDSRWLLAPVPDE